MEKIRTQAVTRLGELQKIKPKVYTALELHPRRAMLERVGRQEQKEFQQRVQKRKLKLKKDISDIDKYLQSVEARDEFFARLPELPNEKELPFPTILPAPTIIFGKKPILKQTRVKRYKHRGGRF